MTDGDGAPARPAVDPAALDGLREMGGDDDEFVLEMVDTYLEDAGQLLAEMRSAAVDHDSERLRRSAHTLKSTSATLGAHRLAATARRVEELAVSGEAGAATEPIEAVAAELAVVGDELRRLVPRQADR